MFELSLVRASLRGIAFVFGYLKSGTWKNKNLRLKGGTFNVFIGKNTIT